MLRNAFLACCLLLGGALLFAQEEDDFCARGTKEYNLPDFSPADFLSVDEGVIVDDKIRLNTDQKLDLENLVLGLDQPFIIDYLSEGAGASHLFGFIFFDIDTDKDGIPDFFETGSTNDLDGDGIINRDDDDDDNDGILDVDDKAPVGVTSMPAGHFRNGVVAAAAGNHIGDYWQFVPNSLLTEGDFTGYFEHPGTYLYIDNNANLIPDAFEYNVGANRVPPYVVDKGVDTRHALLGNMKGLLGLWEYSGTPGETEADRWHWTGSTVYYLADDDGGNGQTPLYHTYSPYGTAYTDSSGSTNAEPDYPLYGSYNIADSRIPSILKNDDGTAKKDLRGRDLFRYRWYESDVSGSRELVFFLVVFYGSGGSNVNTYYSKSGYNRDNPPSNPTRNGATSGDAYGGWSSMNNWYPEFRNSSDHNTLANRVFGVGSWTDIATAPINGSKPVALSPANQEWVDEWENWSSDNRIIQYRSLKDWFSGTAVDANTIINGRYGINMSAENDSSLIRSINGQMAHIMVGAPAETKDAWLLGWEDLYGGGDRDFEDVVFYVKREAGGQLQSQNVAQELADKFDDFSLSQVTFTFTDNFVDSLWGTEGRYIAYYYKLSSSSDWIPLLGSDVSGNEHLREVDLFQPTFGGTSVQADGLVTRTVTIQVEKKSQEVLWKVEMKTDNVDTVRPAIEDVVISYDSLIHDFYYNSAIIPSSNIDYIASFETPEIDWDESKNRGHLYALKTFNHGNPPTNDGLKVTVNPEDTPRDQPSEPFQWDAAVTMKEDLDAGNSRKIYTYIPGDPQAEYNSSLTLKEIDDANIDADILAAFEFSDNKYGNVWVDNYHEPEADERNENGAALWLQNWIHGYADVVTDGSTVVKGPEREWVLGGINRASPTIIRAPGIPFWFTGSAIPVAIKQSYAKFIESDAQKNLPTRVILGTESGMVHCINAGSWVGERKNDDDQWADGHFKNDNFGDGSEVWGMLPGHLLEDIKYNYTGANPITAKIDATAVSSVIYDGSDWKRIIVFSQGYKGGSQTIGGQTRTGNVVWALDVTDPDKPEPMWQRADLNTQDLISPPAVGWTDLAGNGPTWIVAYSTGGTPVSGEAPGFVVVNALTGAKINSASKTVDIPGEVLLGTPALLDNDGNGYVDYLVGATSGGKLFAYNLETNDSVSTQTVADARFYLTPNVRSNSDDTIAVVAVSGDSPLIYDEDKYSQADFNNYLYAFEFDPSDSSWTSLGTFEFPEKHKAFSRPKIIGNKLLVATTTGDTFNFCDYDRDDPGNLYLLDLDELGGDPVIDTIVSYGSVKAPVTVIDGVIRVHQTTHSAVTDQGSVFTQKRPPKPREKPPSKVGDVFGTLGWENKLYLETPPN